VLSTQSPSAGLVRRAVLVLPQPTAVVVVPSWMDLHCTACHFVSPSKSSSTYRSTVLEGGAAGQVLARDRAIKLVVLLTFKQLAASSSPVY